MRILVILVFLASFLSLTNAQEQTEQYNTANPRAEQHSYHPEAGDYGIGFDATPFLNYLGNVANGTISNSLALGDQNLYFRYFLTSNSAVRVKLRVRSEKEVENKYVADDQARVLDPLSQKEIIDRKIVSDNATEVSIGYQVFRGKSKLRGFAGADAGVGFEREKNVFEYGNQMSALNAAPSTAFGPASPRVLEEVVKSNYSFGIGAFTGAEYYFLPKACIGVELGINYSQKFDRQTNSVQEKMVISEYVKENITGDAPSRNRDLNTFMPYSYGNLYIMIQF